MVGRMILSLSAPALRAAALLAVALPVLGASAWLGHLALAPRDPAPGAAPVIWFSDLAPSTLRLAPDDSAAPRVLADGPVAPDLALRDADVAWPVPLPVAAPAPAAPPLAFVPAPPPRPARPRSVAPVPDLAPDLATRLDAPLTTILDLGALPLARSPLPPRRPEATLAYAVPARLDAPPPRPQAARLAVVPDLAPDLAPPIADRAAGSVCGPDLAQAIPRRPRGVDGGRAVLADVAALRGSRRDAHLIRALEQGNLPEHLRALVPVTFRGTGPDGRSARITICVMPDYLAVGSDRDFVRVPMGLPAAHRIAERFDMLLPTAHMVDAIHAQAQVRLAPRPMTPGAQMESTDYFLTHNATVEGQRRASGAPLGALVSGHKKDLVLTNRLARATGRVAIYGWHRANGRPIQPLSTVHGANYADYSHGVRLISRTAWLNGRAVDLADLLADRRTAAALTGDEGAIATGAILAALR